MVGSFTWKIAFLFQFCLFAVVKRGCGDRKLLRLFTSPALPVQERTTSTPAQVRLGFRRPRGLSPLGQRMRVPSAFQLLLMIPLEPLFLELLSSAAAISVCRVLHSCQVTLTPDTTKSRVRNAELLGFAVKSA